ncbi:MAG: N-acetylneuraminate synthase family protein [Elusimicrobia bacterium]|nr:N-acetylneuraminate synthase family protein [Elusimicrobiota bacterium]
MKKQHAQTLLTIGPRKIGPGQPVFFIAEIGVNHNGSLDRAKELIAIAAEAGCDAVKFQKRNLSATYLKRVLDDPNREEQSFSYILPIFKEFEFDEGQYHELVDFAASKNVIFMCTPFDEPSVDFLEKFGLLAYKVASADLTNFVLLEKLTALKKTLILSTGMSTLDEIDQTVAFLKSKKAAFALLHCSSTYPAPLADLNLRLLPKLAERYGVCAGYSGHEPVLGPTVAAVALGAAIVERHITLDKNMEGPDHAASLEPAEIKELMRLIRDVETALGSGVKLMSRGEILNREVLGKSLVAAKAIAKGQAIARNMVTAKSPGKGLSPQFLYKIVGKKAKRDLAADDVFEERDLHGEGKRLKVPTMGGRWGLKTRFAEADFAAGFHSPILEFHMSDRDLDFPWDKTKRFNQELYLHAPEYMGRRMVDLAHPDNERRMAAVSVLQRTIDKARELAPSFKGTPSIVIHVGGMDLELNDNAGKLLDLAADSVRRLDAKGVTLLPENLPPRPWYFSGQWYQNAFVRAEEMARFCKDLNLGMTFDLSHAQLYCNCYGKELEDYAQIVAPYTRHLHIADGAGIQGEGLQIGEGQIDFKRILSILGRGRWSWVPEIWRGHHYGYRGFIVALERLSKIPQLKNR